MSGHCVRSDGRCTRVSGNISFHVTCPCSARPVDESSAVEQREMYLDFLGRDDLGVRPGLEVAEGLWVVN